MTVTAAPGARRLVRRAALPVSFYARDTEIVARELLGMTLECHTAEGVAAGRIVETEAYIGEHDLACHAAAGRTARTAPLYGAPGTAYVYFIYGMYWCVNAVTRPVGHPSAVLIRAVEPLVGIEAMRRRRTRARRDVDLSNGPGKLCQALGIDGRLNCVGLQRPPLLIRAGDEIPDSAVAITPRIGISRSVDWPLRWIVATSAYLSKPPNSTGATTL